VKDRKSSQVLALWLFVIKLFNLSPAMLTSMNMNESIRVKNRRDIVDYRSKFIDLAQFEL